MKGTRLGEEPGGHWGKRKHQKKAAARIPGHWRTAGSEPCRIYEEGEEQMDSKNLLERRHEMVNLFKNSSRNTYELIYLFEE